MNVKEYLAQTQQIRQSHLDLESNCNERGGNSTNHRGVLAEYLNTDIFSRPADLCHACHNPNCSNPKHLYWGTRRENIQDAMQNGTKRTVWQCTVDKHGLEEARRIWAQGNKSAGGKANKGKPKSEEHKRKISESIQAKNQ